VAAEDGVFTILAVNAVGQWAISNQASKKAIQ
jgi:hypothetical protein